MKWFAVGFFAGTSGVLKDALQEVSDRQMFSDPHGPLQRFARWTMDNRRLNVDSTHTSLNHAAARERPRQCTQRARLCLSSQSATPREPSFTRLRNSMQRFLFFSRPASSPCFSSSSSYCTVMTNMSRRQCFAAPASWGKPEHSSRSLWITSHILMTMLDCPQASSLSREKNVAAETEYLPSAACACCCAVARSFLLHSSRSTFQNSAFQICL